MYLTHRASPRGLLVAPTHLNSPDTEGNYVVALRLAKTDAAAFTAAIENEIGEYQPPRSAEDESTADFIFKMIGQGMGREGRPYTDAPRIFDCRGRLLGKPRIASGMVVRVSYTLRFFAGFQSAVYFGFESATFLSLSAVQIIS